MPVKDSWRIGADEYMDDLFLTTAHGSYGIVSTISSAYLVADLMTGKKTKMNDEIVKSLNASRFLYRNRRKNIAF